MKKFILFAFSLVSIEALAVCSAPISRTNVGTNTVLSSTKYNSDLNTAYNKINNLPGDCVVDESLSGSKLIDATVTGAKLVNSTVSTAKIADGAITAAKLATAIENLVPVGSMLPFLGSTAPSGYLLCNGQSVSRTTYASLFAVLGTTYGSIDGNSFNLPDCRFTFLRGYGANVSVSGSGSASSNNATFSNHGVIRTGMKVRLVSGTLSGLAASTNYFAIVVDANTLAFATSYSNAIASTKISISGSNSATIRQWEDPDFSSRLQSSPGGATSGLGTRQDHEFYSHKHNSGTTFGGGYTSSSWYGYVLHPNQGSITSAANNVTSGSIQPLTSNEGGEETRPQNIYVNYIIKI